MKDRRLRTGTVAVAILVALGAGGCTQDQTSADDPAAGSPAPSSEPPAPPAPGLPQWQGGVPGINVPRDDFATVAVGQDIWAFGGMSGGRGTRLDSMEIFDTRTRTWRTSDIVMPEGLASFEAAAIGEKIYVFGGLDKDSQPSDFSGVLDTSTGKWRDLPPLPAARYTHSVTLHDGLIYVIGGEDNKGFVEEVDIFDPRSETWSKGAPMPKPRGSHDAVSAGDVLYVLGGWRGGAPTDLVQTYDPAADRWASAAPLPEPVMRAGAAVLDGRLWVSRNDWSGVLDIASGTWSVANPLTVPREGLGLIAVGSAIYAIAGCTPSPLRDVRTVDVLAL